MSTCPPDLQASHALTMAPLLSAVAEATPPYWRMSHTFFAAFEVRDVVGPTGPESWAEATAAAASSPRRILIVDDAKGSVSETLARLYGKLGYFSLYVGL